MDELKVPDAFAGFGGQAIVTQPEEPQFHGAVNVTHDDTEQAYVMIGMPGLVSTPWTNRDGWAPLHERVAEMAPLRRVGTAEDVAAVCTMLACSDYVTGEVVVIDGGLGLAGP